MKAISKTRPAYRRDPVVISPGVSYYERRKHIEVQVINGAGAIVVACIPWERLMESAKRCVPEMIKTDGL